MHDKVKPTEFVFPDLRTLGANVKRVLEPQ